MFYGRYVFVGFWVTLRRFLLTYVHGVRERIVGRKRKVLKQHPSERGLFTVQYPEERLPTPERFRVIPFLLYDEPEKIRCTACGICAKVCPPQCIWIVQAEGPEGKMLPKPSEFYIDIDVCMNCGLCSEFCPFDAIKMDHDFELANSERAVSHIFDMKHLLKPSAYYAKTHPVANAEEEARRKKPGAATHV